MTKAALESIKNFRLGRDRLLLPIAVLFALAVYALILTVPPSPDFAARFYTSELNSVLLLIVFMSLVISRRGYFWEAIALALILALFALALVYKWQAGTYDGSMIGGILPWSDAGGYYFNSQILLHGGNLTIWGTRRPLFAGLLAALLAVTRNNLQVALALLVLINALSVYFGMREVQSNLNSLSAGFFAVVSYIFYSNFAGSTMTENLGFSLGMFGFTFLLQGVRKKESRRILFGLYILTLALNARAGAFFILPTQLVWLVLDGQHKETWIQTAIVGALVVCLGFVSNLAMVKLIGSADAVPFSNYAYTFYGLASGNKGWDQVIYDHPEATETDVPRLALEKFKQNPRLLLSGMLGAYQDFFSDKFGAFSFAWRGTGHTWKGLTNLMMWGLSLVALAIAIVQRHSTVYRFGLAGFLGILLSVSLLPPIDAESMRVYAATIPVLIFVCCLGLGALTTPLQTFGLIFAPQAENRIIDHMSFIVCTSLLLFSLVVPPLLRLENGSELRSTTLICPAPQTAAILTIEGGSALHLVSDFEAQESYLPILRLTDFRDNFRHIASGSPFAKLESGAYVGMGNLLFLKDLKLPHTTIYVISKETLPAGLYEGCIKPSQLGLLTPFAYEFQPRPAAIDHLGINDRQDNPALRAAIRFSYLLGLGCIAGLIMLDLLHLWSAPSAKRVLILANAFLMSIGILIFFHCSGWVPLAWEAQTLDVRKAVHIRGYLYVIDLESSWMSDTTLWHYPVKLYENGSTLRPPHEDKSVIAHEGLGTNAFSGRYLYFSSSDNTDPATNEREYRLVRPVPIRKRYQLGFYVLTLICIYAHNKYLRE